MIRSLDTILHTDTHMTHLLQALRERCEPNELHKLLQACCASICWAKNDGQSCQSTASPTTQTGARHRTHTRPCTGHRTRPPTGRTWHHRQRLRSTVAHKRELAGLVDATSHLAPTAAHECFTHTKNQRRRHAGPAADSHPRQPESEAAHAKSGVEAGDISADPERLSGASNRGDEAGPCRPHGPDSLSGHSRAAGAPRSSHPYTRHRGSGRRPPAHRSD